MEGFHGSGRSHRHHHSQDAEKVTDRAIVVFATILFPGLLILAGLVAAVLLIK